MRAAPLLFAVLSASIGCSAAGGARDDLGGKGGAGGSAGADASAGGSGGEGGLLLDGGDGGAFQDATLSDGSGNLNDGAIEAEAGACTDAGYVPGPIVRVCAAATDDECGGTADVNPKLPNGTSGNDFDDDCDGEVDEGCACGAAAAGETKPCWLVPSSQVDAQTGEPAGWCAQNSRGTQRCRTVGTGENPLREWDGECRGAQPAFGDDVCAAGDFDCDGREVNSKADDCSCANATVQCPTQPLVLAPYPDVNNLPGIDGASWIVGGSPALASNWQWTVTGGDCDNVLPWPSFAMFATPSTFLAPGVGVPASNLGPAGDQRGWVAGPSPAAPSKIYPAFGLSGDYLVQGEFDLGGKHHTCTVKVQVRAPGIRTELCWTPMPNDVDLHFARLQNPDACTAGGEGHGWFQTCRTDQRSDDCYYLQASGCTGFTGNPSPWGYSQSAYAACHGWGSRRDVTKNCDNPRLDQDNIDCDPTEPNPNGAFGLGGTGAFCGAENINLDNPKAGDRFAIAAHAYAISTSVKVHANIYCNGVRKLSLGYDPTAGQQYPELQESHAMQGGDFWEIAEIDPIVDASGTMTDCTVAPVHSVVPKPSKDGSTDVCVDTNPQNGALGDERKWKFQADGEYPATAAGLCWH